LTWVNIETRVENFESAARKETGTQKTTEVHKADPGARRNAMILLLLVAVLGAMSIVLIESNKAVIFQWIELNLAPNLMALNAVFIVLLMPLLFGAYYLFTIGGRGVRAQRFPPLDQPVFRDTRIILGEAATRRGRVLQFLSIVIAVIVFCTIVVVRRLKIMWNISQQDLPKRTHTLQPAQLLSNSLHCSARSSRFTQLERIQRTGDELFSWFLSRGGRCTTPIAAFLRQWPLPVRSSVAQVSR
jgi:hypothetical protein